MLKILNITLNIIILLIIFNQLVLLSNFVYNYNFHYDYGNKLGEICTIENVEYETSRYQLNKNINNIEISNLNENIILIISIIFTISISIIFTFIFFNEFCNIQKNFMNYTFLQKVYIIFATLITLCILIYPILLIIFKLLNLKYYDIISLYNHNINKRNLYITLSIFSILVIFRLITIINNYNIPDFEIIEVDKNIKYMELSYFIFYAFIYIGVIYYITNILILYNYKINNIIVDKNEFSDNKNLISQYINKLFGVSEHYKYIEKIEYKKSIDLESNKTHITKNDNLPNNLNNYNNIPSEYISEIEKNIIELLDKNNVKDANIIEQIKILIIKLIKQYIIIKYNNNGDNKNCEKELYDSIITNIDIKTLENKEIISSIIVQKITKTIDKLNIEIINNNNITNNKFIKKVDNKEFYISDRKSIFRKNTEGLLFIIGVFLLSIFIVNIGINYYNKNIGLRIKYNIIIPLFCLYIIILILISNDTFNKIVNNYIINNPKYIYKNNINNINFNFNKILENEFYIYENTNNTLCINAKNSFVSVINNVLFNKNIILLKTEENAIINFPENLKNYENDCNNNLENIDYNLETNFDNIFYDINDCSVIHYNKIKAIIKNTVIYNVDSSELKNLLKDIKNTKFNDNIPNTILYNIIYTNKKYDNIKILIIKIKERLKNLLTNTLYNTIILKKSYDNKEIDDKENITYLKDSLFNDYINANNTNNEINKYNYIVDNIIEEFINMIIINQYLLSKIIDDDNTLSDIIYNNEIDNNFKLKKQITEYINNFITLYQSYLNKLDLIFKNKYYLNKKTNRISLYLINIYNNLNKENPYYDDIIYPRNKKNENVLYYKNILSNFNKNLTDIINDYNKLSIICYDKKNLNNNECDIHNTNYDKKVLTKEIENIIRINYLNIDKYLNLINNEIITNKNFIHYINLNYNSEDDILIKYSNFDDILNKLKIYVNEIKEEYNDILFKYYDNNENIYIIDEDEEKNELKLITLKTQIFNMFYKNDNSANMKMNNERLINIKNIIIYLLKNIDTKKEEKIYEKKENIINLNTKINEVNYIFIYLIIIYIIIIFLIKYIK